MQQHTAEIGMENGQKHSIFQYYFAKEKSYPRQLYNLYEGRYVQSAKKRDIFTKAQNITLQEFVADFIDVCIAQKRSHMTGSLNRVTFIDNFME